MKYHQLKKRIKQLEERKGDNQPIFLMNPSEEEIEKAALTGQQIYIIEMEGLGRDPHAYMQK